MKLPATNPLSVNMIVGARSPAIGRIALDRGVGVFEYDADFGGTGISLNPLWPVATGEQIVPRDARAFRGLHGTFADSLPDAWGEELMRRRLAREGLAYDALTPLDRLALVGDRGMGALTYRPAVPQRSDGVIDLDVFAVEANRILQGDESDVLPELYRLGGASGGARPKVLVAFDGRGNVRDGVGVIPDGYDAWLVKFRSRTTDPVDIGPLEAAYATMARGCGMQVPDHRLIDAAGGPGYFATKRFDRGGGRERRHMLSAAAILDADWREPGADYDLLLRLVREVTRSHSDVEEMFRRMVFNVVAHNRDDHVKQHAFLYEHEARRWILAPAYDLSPTQGPGGEHYLAVAGQGRDITGAALRRVAEMHAIGSRRLKAVVAEVLDGVTRFDAIARDYGVSQTTRTATSKLISECATRVADVATGSA